MPTPAPTELLAEDIRDLRETNHRMAARLDSLDAAVRDLGRDLGHLRAEVASEIGGLRAEMATEIGGLRTEIGGLRTEVVEKLGAINTNLEKFQARTDTSLRNAGWAITILAPVVIALIGAAFLGIVRAPTPERPGPGRHRVDWSRLLDHLARRQARFPGGTR